MSTLKQAIEEINRLKGQVIDLENQIRAMRGGRTPTHSDLFARDEIISRIIEHLKNPNGNQRLIDEYNTYVRPNHVFPKSLIYDLRSGRFTYGDSSFSKGEIENEITRAIAERHRNGCEQKKGWFW